MVTIMASLLSPLDDLHVSSNCSANKLGTTVSKVCLHMHECPTGLRSQAGNVNTIRLVTHTQIELITLVGVDSKVVSVCVCSIVTTSSPPKLLPRHCVRGSFGGVSPCGTFRRQHIQHMHKC